MREKFGFIINKLSKLSIITVEILKLTCPTTSSNACSGIFAL